MANKKKPRAATKPTVRMTKIEFFDNVSGRLEIHEDSDGEFSDCELRANAIDTKTKNFRRLTAAELDSVVFRGKQIRLRGMAGKVVSHDAPNGEFFTVRDMLHAVEETERRTRGQSDWFGEVDFIHIFFEGIRLADDGVWDITWGS